MKMRNHHIVQWIFLPALLVGSDLFIGFYGHYSGTVENIFKLDNFINYITSTDNIYSLLVVFVIAIIVMAATEWIVKERLNEKKKKS